MNDAAQERRDEGQKTIDKQWKKRRKEKQRTSTSISPGCMGEEEQGASRASERRGRDSGDLVWAATVPLRRRPGLGCAWGSTCSSTWGSAWRPWRAPDAASPARSVSSAGPLSGSLRSQTSPDSRNPPWSPWRDPRRSEQGRGIRLKGNRIETLEVKGSLSIYVMSLVHARSSGNIIMTGLSLNCTLPS